MDKLKIKTIFKSEFLRNIFTLLSGASFAQLITFITIPILTRIYTPEDFGFIAIYLSICNILVTVATGRYEYAIMLPKDNRNALAIIKGTSKIILLTSLIVLVLIVILKNTDYKILEFIKPNYFYFIPLSVAVLAFIKVLLQWESRNKKFKIQATAKIAQSSFTNATNIGFGFLQGFQKIGLFFGHIIGQSIQLVILTKSIIKKEGKQFQNIKKEEIRSQLKTNLNFPLYSAPMGVLNAFSIDILIYTLNLFFSTTFVGLYSNANKAINYPLNLISQSFTSVFYQKISETNKKVKLYITSYFLNFILAGLALIPIIIWGEEIFMFFLGKEWEIAGSIAKYLAPLTITSFAMRSVSNIFSLTRKNKSLLIWQVIYLLLIIIVIFFSKSLSFEILLLNVSIFGSLMYIVLAILGYSVIKKYHEID